MNIHDKKSIFILLFLLIVSPATIIGGQTPIDNPSLADSITSHSAIQANTIDSSNGPIELGDKKDTTSFLIKNRLASRLNTRDIGQKITAAKDKIFQACASIAFAVERSFSSSANKMRTTKNNVTDKVSNVCAPVTRPINNALTKTSNYMWSTKIGRGIHLYNNAFGTVINFFISGYQETSFYKKASPTRKFIINNLANLETIGIGTLYFFLTSTIAATPIAATAMTTAYAHDKFCKYKKSTIDPTYQWLMNHHETGETDAYLQSTWFKIKDKIMDEKRRLAYMAIASGDKPTLESLCKTGLVNPESTPGYDFITQCVPNDYFIAGTWNSPLLQTAFHTPWVPTQNYLIDHTSPKTVVKYINNFVLDPSKRAILRNDNAQRFAIAQRFLERRAPDYIPDAKQFFGFLRIIEQEINPANGENWNAYLQALYQTAMRKSPIAFKKHRLAIINAGITRNDICPGTAQLIGEYYTPNETVPLEQMIAWANTEIPTTP